MSTTLLSFLGIIAATARRPIVAPARPAYERLMPAAATTDDTGTPAALKKPRRPHRPWPQVRFYFFY